MNRPRLAGVGLLLLAVACRGGEQPAANDWSQVIAGLSQRLSALRARADLAPDVRDSNLPLAALEIEKLQFRLLLPWRGVTWEDDQTASRLACSAALDRAEAGQVAHLGQTGGEGEDGYFTRAYFCRTDGSAQPYHLRLPDGFRPTETYPLVIFLHGYVTETAKALPWVLVKEQWDLAAARGMIFCIPHGRRNSDFLGIGEVDVLRVIEELRRWYRLDPDRIYLTGCSMGGYGGWALGLRHPDEFAAMALMSGQTDFFVWDRRDRDEVRFKSFCILQNNPIDLARNARNLPVYLQHGELDHLVPVEHSRLIAPVMRDLGYTFTYDEREGLGHYLYWENEPIERMLDSLRGRRRPAAPAHVTFRTYTTRYAQAWWVDPRRFQRKTEPADVDARVADGRLTVTTANVAELWLDLPESLRGAGSLPLTVNGAAAGSVGAGPHRVAIDEGGRPSPAAPGTPGPRPLMGPFREVFSEPFIAVIGTAGDDAADTRNTTRANRFQQVWYQFAEGIAPLLRDVDLTAEQVAANNLVIFGEPGTVRLPGIDDAAALLPRGVTLEPGRYVVGERSYAGDDLGCYLLGPHPRREGGLIGWCSGAEYGAGLPANHQFDLIPELLIYSGETDWDGTNKYRLGGFLGWDWQLDESLLDERPAEQP